MYKDLEFVCGGNSGRSPIEAAVAIGELRKRKYFEVRVSSSGAFVEFIKTATDKQVQGMILPYLPLLIEKRFMNEDQERDIRAGKDVKAIIAPISDSITKKETERVEEVLSKMGLLQYVNQIRLRQPKQTRARPEAELILVNGEENLARVREIYSLTTYNPVIENLGEFKDPVFASFQEHKYLAEKLALATIKAIARFYK